MRALRRLWLVVAVVCVATVMGGCGGDDEAPEAQPAKDAPVFVEGGFGTVPVHPLATPVGSRSTKDDVIAQSYEIRNVSREQLFDWYGDKLEGWTTEVEPGPITTASDGAWRGIWTKGDRRLLVTASAGPTLSEGSSDQRLQYSLSLEPSDRPLPEADASSNQP